MIKWQPLSSRYSRIYCSDSRSTVPEVVVLCSEDPHEGHLFFFLEARDSQAREDLGERTVREKIREEKIGFLLQERKRNLNPKGPRIFGWIARDHHRSLFKCRLSNYIRQSICFKTETMQPCSVWLVNHSCTFRFHRFDSWVQTPKICSITGVFFIQFFSVER